METEQDFNNLVRSPPSFSGLIGIARRDVTPPVGIYSRLWGAAKHDVAAGIHRPMTVTAVAFQTRAGGERSSLLLVSLDLSHLPEGDEIVGHVATNLKLGRAALIVACSHTHSSPWLGRDRESMPGGDLLPAYRETLVTQITAAGREAIDHAQPATVTWRTGRCALATQRDLPDPQVSGKYVCGFNPNEVADDTLLVARITRDEDDRIIGTIVNYACHPTTLGWDNKLISPDYVGAMREVIEGGTGGAPCAFVQGASGELAPALQYVGDTSIADGHGRAVGYAAMSTLSMMLPPRRELYYVGAVQSGTALGLWGTRAYEPSRQLGARQFDVALPLKEPETLKQHVARQLDCQDRAADERRRRHAWVRERVGGKSECPVPVWGWRIGGALFAGFEGEAYSVFQRDLRQAFPQAAVVVMNVVNGGGIGYVCPPKLAASVNIYQAWQSPFAAGALPALTHACESNLRELCADEVAPGESTFHS